MVTARAVEAIKTICKKSVKYYNFNNYSCICIHCHLKNSFLLSEESYENKKSCDFNLNVLLRVYYKYYTIFIP